MTGTPSQVLRFGPYPMPAGYGIGDMMYCNHLAREVEIVCVTDAPVQWFRARRHSLVLHGELIRAVKMESTGAVAENWGVSTDTVSKWRRALGVGRMTPGTTAVWREVMPQRMNESEIVKGRARSRRKASRAKMAASKAGAPMHVNTRKALLRAVKGPKSQAHREAMSRSHKARGTMPPNIVPWTATEDARLGTAPDKEIAAELGRSVDSIRKRRNRLQIARYQAAGTSD